LPAFGAFQPFHFWAGFDLFALLATAAVAMRIERARGHDLAPGMPLGLYLSVYGALRFMLEFARDLSPVAGPFTSGQIMSAVQVLAGIVLLAFLRRTRVSMHGRC
jgi:prolipoprotein diacylglyceryltransferase